jgi:hypothetical protein
VACGKNDRPINQRPPARSSIPEDRQSRLRAVISLPTVVNFENVNCAAALVDPVNNAISAAPGTVTADKWPEQWLADPVRVHPERGIAELQHGRGYALRKPLSYCPS